MKRFGNLKGRWLGSVAAVSALLLAGACTQYRPLDQGSRVPWAKARMPAERPVALADEERAAVRAVAAAAGPAPPPRKRNEPGMQVSELPRPAPAAELSGPVHRVGRGETLTGVARRYGLGVGEIAAANRLEPPYTIYTGQILRLPAESERSIAVAPAAGPEPGGEAREYVVQRGDNLTAIARRLDVPMRAMARANDIDPPYTLRPGQELVVPDAASEVAVARREPASPPRDPGEPPARSDAGFLWPVDGKVVGKFGRTDGGQRRDGIDIAARKGAPVRAAENGVVVYAGDAIRGYGRMVLLRHDGDYITTYAHNSAILVNVGDVVERGQVIARVGDTGSVETAKLHFELRKGRKPLDPERILVKGSTSVASTE